MEFQDLRKICNALPGVTEDVKWTNNLCFCVGKKMFLILGLDQEPVPASFKVPDVEFYPMSHRDGFKPAPYLARYKWVSTDDIRTLNQEEWEHYIQQSYELIRNKLPAKIKKSLI